MEGDSKLVNKKELVIIKAREPLPGRSIKSASGWWI